MPPIIFRPGAEAEMREAYSYYEEREPGLGSDFMRCVDACLQLIRRHPQIFPAVHGEIRQALIRRFPFSIFYIPENESIIVPFRFSCFAESQNLDAELTLRA